MNFDKLIFLLINVFIITTIIVPVNFRVFSIPVSGDEVLFLIIILYLLKIITDKKMCKKFRENLYEFFMSGIGISMGALLIVMMISVFYALEKNLAISETARFAAYITLVFIVKHEVKNEKMVKSFINTIVASTAFVSVFGIIQWFTGIGLSKDFIEQFSFGATKRIASTFGNPNSFAAFLVFFIFPFIMMTFNIMEIKEKLVYIFLSVIMLVNMVLTFSRNSWLAFGLGCLLLTVYLSWKAIVSMGLLGLISLFIPVIRNRLRDFTDVNQNISRIKHWKTAFLMIKDHPILGLGNGNYVSYYDEYISKHPELDFALQKRFPTHNSYLKVASELGIIGFIPFVVLIITSMIQIKKTTQKIFDKKVKAFYKGILISILMFLIMNIFDNLFFVPKVTTWFWFVVAIGEGLIQQRN